MTIGAAAGLLISFVTIVGGSLMTEQVAEQGDSDRALGRSSPSRGLIATVGFALYVSSVANYGATYGALAGVIILMLCFYVTALILVGAGELVALFTKRTEPERLEARRQSIRADPAPQDATGTIGRTVDDVQRRLGGEGGADSDPRPPRSSSPAS